MDLSKVLAQLREELNNLDAAILSLERLKHEERRPGRPPKALTQITKTARPVEKRKAATDTSAPEEG